MIGILLVKNFDENRRLRFTSLNTEWWSLVVGPRLRTTLHDENVIDSLEFGSMLVFILQTHNSYQKHNASGKNYENNKCIFRDKVRPAFPTYL